MGTISVSCRYFYRNGSCAHGGVPSDKCVGSANCNTFIAVERPGTTVPDMTSSADLVCEYNLGYGIYCKKYQKFYCAGRGNCESPEDFMRAFDAHRKKRGGPDNGNHV